MEEIVFSMNAVEQQYPHEINDVDPCLIVHKIKSKLYQILKVRPNSLKCLWNVWREALWHWTWPWFHEYDNKKTGKKIDSLDILKMKMSLHQKRHDTLKGDPWNVRKYFANHMKNKRLILEYAKNIYNSTTTTKLNNRFKKGTKHLTRHINGA